MNPTRNKKDFETTVNRLRELSYSYLQKYSPSKQQLKTYLLKKLLNGPDKNNINQLPELIDIVLQTLEKGNLINDKIYSDSKAKIFLKKGYSINKIRYSLIKKGLDQNYVKESISKIKENETDPDFFSAIKLCKRRRIGPSREESNRTLFYKKDIAILARSGFTYETSKSILEISKDEFKKFCKMI